jgi:hypothetical protein
MTRPIPRLLAVIVTFAAVGTGRQCLAHFPWLTTDKSGHALLFFSENPAERDYHLPECVAQAEVTLLGDEGRAIDLAEVDEDGFVGRRSETEVPADRELVTACQYGIYPHHFTNQQAAKPEEEMPSVLSPLPEGVASFGAAVCDGWLYVYSGHTGREHEHSRDNLSRHFLRIRIDGQGDWQEMPMETPLQGLPLVAAGGKLYRIGGLDARNAAGEDADLHSVADFHVFDPATRKWQALPPLPEPRSSHDAAVIGSKIYVVGGWTLDGPDSEEWLDTAWVYDTSQSPGRWQELSSPPFRRRALAAAAWNGKLVALGGIDDDGLVSEEVDLFDPDTGEWTRLADYPGGDMAGFGMSAWGLDSGLYAGGAEGVLHCLADDGQSWTKVGKLEQPRFFHRLLPAGRDSLFAVAGASMSHGHVGTIEELHVDAEP